MEYTQFTCICIISIILTILVIGRLVIYNHISKKAVKNLEDNDYDNQNQPVLIELSPEKIVGIHLSGKITPAEFIEELESLGTCISLSADNAEPRCKQFQNCHACLVDWANSKGEDGCYSIIRHLQLRRNNF